ncbi:HNH endonuclease [Alphaproteobacteria bacterium]|nr:HNH endonuclease [Alphaproteobacteria bacterium]
MENNETKNKLPIISQIRGMIAEQSFKCAITGRNLTPENTTGDHIVPLSRKDLNPSTNASNVWIVDRNVNKLKSNLTYDELLTLAKEIVANENVARELILKRSKGDFKHLNKDDFTNLIEGE